MMARMAIRMAETLEYQPLVGRCFYYRGMAQYGQKRWMDAQLSFEEAEACKGKYKEGVYVDKWIARVAKKLQRGRGNRGDGGGAVAKVAEVAEREEGIVCGA